MARGETTSRSIPTAAITTFAGVIVVALLIAAAVLRPWHADRTILDAPSHSLVLRLRGNALGSHCEIFDELAPDRVILSECGLVASLSDFGSRDAARTVDMRSNTCVIELEPLREVACLPGRAEWMVTDASYVTVGIYDGATMEITEIERASGRTTHVAQVPSDTYLNWGMGEPMPTFTRSSTGERFRLLRGALVPTGE